jgi:hypothetical protein
MKKTIYYIFGILVLLLIAFAIAGFIKFNFTDSDNIVLESETEVNENIHLSNPIANTIITSPLVIKGEARGTWFFEASFPVILTNWDGLIIAEGIATAEGEWMTTDFVPFIATLNFTKPDYGNNGFLILKKDNPSGLPEHDDALEIQVKFE